jgi:hypothetical protein
MMAGAVEEVEQVAALETQGRAPPRLKAVTVGLQLRLATVRLMIKTED